MRDKVLEQEAANLYNPALPYHNFEHAKDAVRAGRLILQRCREEGIRVDEDVVYYALLFHDAGYHEDHREKGFPTKEAYSAHLASAALRARGVSERVIRKVEAAINSTHRDASFRTAEQKAVRAADLSGLAASYAVFRTNTERLRSEYEMLTGEHVEWAEWVQRVAATLQIYLRQEIRLTSYFAADDGESLFHQRARRNLARLIEELGMTPAAPRPGASRAAQSRALS